MHKKNEWRSMLLRRRRQLSTAMRAAYSAAIVERLRESPEFGECGGFLSYSPMGAEVDPTALTDSAREAGKLVSVATPTGWQRDPGAEELSNLDILGCAAGRAPYVVLVPGVGFDLTGVRLGRGGGHFDRVLRELRGEDDVFVVGVAFEVQVVPRLPRDPWDQSVDLVATERRLIIPGRGRAQREHPTAGEENSR